MRYSVEITALRRDNGLLAFILTSIFHRGLFPEYFCSRMIGRDTVRIWLKVVADEKDILGLREHWEFVLRVQAVRVHPPLPEITPHVPATAAMA